MTIWVRKYFPQALDLQLTGLSQTLNKEFSIIWRRKHREKVFLECKKELGITTFSVIITLAG